MSEIDDEARARIRAEVEEVKRRAMGQAPPEKKPKLSPGAPRPAQFSDEERARRREAAQKYDHDEIVRLYLEEKLTSYQIATKLGANRMTIVKALKKREVWNPETDGKNGRPFSEYCEANLHLMETHREERPIGSGNFQCAACRRVRDKKYKREARERKKDNRLSKHGNGWMVILEGKEAGIILVSDETAAALDAKLRQLSHKRGQNHDG